MVALAEARRILKPGGRLLLLAQTRGDDVALEERRLAEWCRIVDLRLSPPRRIPSQNARWLLAVATLTGERSAAA